MRLITTALVTVMALAAAPLVAAPAHAAETTITGVAKDSSGKPLSHIHWEIHTLENGKWTTLQFGPKLTDSKGRFSRKMPMNGKYRVCFYDDYYDSANTTSGYWQPEVRHRDTCWPKATTLGSAQTWTPTAAAPSKTFNVTLPQQGLGMAPVDPFVSGTYEIGKPLTVVGQEGWRPTNATFSYQWFSQAPGSSPAAISGATRPTFTPTTAQNGRWLFARVSASRAGYKPVTELTPYTKAGGSHVQTTAPLKITGAVTPGNTITASYGKPGNTYGAIQWFIDGVPTPDGPSYDTASWPFKVTSAHTGTLIEARLSIYRTDANRNYVDGSNSYQRVQVQVPGQRPAQVLPATPVPRGEATVGRVIQAPSKITADANAIVRYQWMRNAKPISGATARTYKLTQSDFGKKVNVRSTVTRPGWLTPFVTTSKATVAKGSIKKGKVTVKGTARVGKKLKVTTKGWGPKPVKVSYRWLRNGKSIKGATKSIYTVKKADRKKKISVKVAVRKSKYTTATKKSRSITIKR